MKWRGWRAKHHQVYSGPKAACLRFSARAKYSVVCLPERFCPMEYLEIGSFVSPSLEIP